MTQADFIVAANQATKESGGLMDVYDFLERVALMTEGREPTARDYVLAHQIESERLKALQLSGAIKEREDEW